MSRRVNLADVVGPISAADAAGKSAVRAALDLGSVDDTADANKPISVATQKAFDALAGALRQKADASALGEKADVRHAHDLASSSSAGFMSGPDKVKLAGIAAAATANSPDAYLLNRTNHVGEIAQSDVAGLREALAAVATPFASVAALKADTATHPVGAVLRADPGHLYGVVASDEHFTTAGGAKLRFLGDCVTPEAFGADPTGVADSTAAFNLAMRVAVATKKPGRSSGIYKMSGTLAPGGRYAWDWGNTELNWGAAANSGATITGFTELMENPAGTVTPQGSGKRVLFNTIGCTNAVNAGILVIAGSYPGAMTLAGRALINPSIVAISASNGSSADMTWNALIITGCGYGLWQGDQRGSAPNILPYTRWSISYLRIQKSLVALECGRSGNGFDDIVISELRFTQTAGRSSIFQSDLGGGVAFLNGLAPDRDMEPQTISTTAGSPTATLSADNALISAGTIIVIKDGGLNKAGGSTHFAARVTAKAGTTLTLERNAEVTAAAATFYCNPPEMFLQGSTWRFQQTYLEEIHEIPMRLFDRAGITGVVKVSNGDLSSRYDCGILLHQNSTADLMLHAKIVNASKVKRVVGVASARKDFTYNSNRVRIVVPSDEAFATVNSDPVGIVALAASHLSADFPADASGDENPNIELRVDFTDATCLYQRHGTAGRVGWRSRNGRGLDTGAPLLITAATATGSFSGPAGGTSSKTAGGNGALLHPVTAGRTYLVTVTLSAVTSAAPQVRWYNAGASVSTEATIARGIVGRHTMLATVPAAGVNQLALFASAAESFTVTEFSVAEVLSI